MSIEGYPPPEQPEENPGLTAKELAGRIDLMRDEPANLVHFMQDALGIDLTSRWGWLPNATISEIEDKCQRLTRDDHDAINYTADLVGFFGRYSIYSPAELGRRLDWLDPDLGGSPLDLIFEDYPHDPINKDATRRFIDLSVGAIRPPLTARERSGYLFEHQHLTVIDEKHQTPYNS